MEQQAVARGMGRGMVGGMRVGTRSRLELEGHPRLEAGAGPVREVNGPMGLPARMLAWWGERVAASGAWTWSR